MTSALFQQFDFSKTQILDDFEAGLETSVRGQMTESGLHMGTSLRQLVYTFRQRTLLLLKALILQKRVCAISLVSYCSYLADNVLRSPSRTPLHISIFTSLANPGLVDYPVCHATQKSQVSSTPWKTLHPQHSQTEQPSCSWPANPQA